MKIKKTELLSFIDGAITRLQKQHGEQHKEAVKEAQARYDEWQRKTAPLWDRVVTNITTARKAKKPITIDVLRPVLVKEDPYGYLSGSLQFGSELKLPTETKSEVPHDLAGMRSLLNAISDEEIDVRQLSLAEIRNLYRTYGK